MSKGFTLNQLTEGIRNRNMGAEGNRLIQKWTRTGLLRGLDDYKRETMSRLLENQAAQLPAEDKWRQPQGTKVDGVDATNLPESSELTHAPETLKVSIAPQNHHPVRLRNKLINSRHALLF